ncbi:MAG TPA: hypothetical protein VHQ86_03125 [Candidatus Saccharimonadia bacterium]|jgi:dihydroorotate dehydrogenase|nr:hypothetical protein [Candidatus Saccharimonadia bacterium]
MLSSGQQPIYDPAKTYAENFDHGPFGEFALPIPYHDKGRPQFNFFGRPMFSPFGIAAGPLLNAKYVIAALNKGFDLVTYKTQRTVAFEVNPFPNVLAVDVDGDLTLDQAKKPLVAHAVGDDPDLSRLTITNSFAVPSRGPEFWMPDYARCLAAVKRGQMVIMSVQGTIQPGFSTEDYYNDFAEAVKLAVQAGAPAIEINLSCPNVSGEGVLCYSPGAVTDIVRRCRTAAGKTPLIIKLGYYAPDQQELLETIMRAVAPLVAAVAAVNTIPGSVVTPDGEPALPGRDRTGLCGAGIKWAGLDMTRRLAELRERLGLRFAIIGIGGVMNPADYQAYRDAGADMVQAATAVIWNPELAIDVKSLMPRPKNIQGSHHGSRTRFKKK